MTWLPDLKLRVDARLAAFFAEKAAYACALEPSTAELVRALSAFTMRGGKRVRPAVCAAAYAAVTSDDDLAPVVDAGACLELLHSYLLIHDDWMDQDDERRGGPTVHAHFRSLGHAHHAADSLAILTGDLASGYAWQLFLSLPFGSNATRATKAFLAVQEDVVLGQSLDVTHSDNIALVEQLKTGSYTLRGPMHMGALLGGATDAQLASLDAIAAPLGRAFQMRDDLLGTFGSASKTGKSVQNDLRAGKRTALVLAAQQCMSTAQRDVLQGALGNAHATEAELQAARDALVQCGAKANVERALASEIQTARHALDVASFAPVGDARLSTLIDLLAHREQ